ncbi:hypothetical protein PFICI_10401 [Pestalotiopsis fici W106-1]|uniref:Azaphilone pigments biosynthesis cluster protein L N-terminal domain-containing protein n=1 Tax=Pestalotiopsis fici (strain W106-1 / CGMCC3.15140) TaxID=1229662 RepID=W3WX20_PESFW|nr:uncharacterized protein PFICI_10401 [Pestalotiopsis fici W106-1]ETS78339.1 hypothetical protein PFICI_10401 [Pestalotiopsis fici W106-1]
MDPLSITTSSLALITVVAKTSIAITTFIRECREARGDLTSVNRELSELKIVLELLQEDTADQNSELLLSESLRAQILSIIHNCGDVSTKVEQVLTDLRKSRVGAIKWVLDRKKEVASLKHSITKAVKEDTGVIREDVVEIKQDTAQILDEIERLKERLPLSDRDFVIQGYLDSLTTYAATVYDALDDDENEIKDETGHESDPPSPEVGPSIHPVLAPAIEEKDTALLNKATSDHSIGDEGPALQISPQNAPDKLLQERLQALEEPVQHGEETQTSKESVAHFHSASTGKIRVGAIENSQVNAESSSQLSKIVDEPRLGHNYDATRIHTPDYDNDEYRDYDGGYDHYPYEDGDDDEGHDDDEGSGYSPDYDDGENHDYEEDQYSDDHYFGEEDEENDDDEGRGYSPNYDQDDDHEEFRNQITGDESPHHGDTKEERSPPSRPRGIEDRHTTGPNVSIAYSNVSNQGLQDADHQKTGRQPTTVPTEASHEERRTPHPLLTTTEPEQVQAFPPSSQGHASKIKHIVSSVSGSQSSPLFWPSRTESCSISTIKSGDLGTITKGTNPVIAMGLSQDGVYGAFVQQDRTISVWDLRQNAQKGRGFKRKRFGLTKPDMVQIIKNEEAAFNDVHLYVLLYSSTEAAYELYDVGMKKQWWSSKGVHYPRLFNNLCVLSVTNDGELEMLTKKWTTKVWRSTIYIPPDRSLKDYPFHQPRIIVFAVNERGTDIAYLCEEKHCYVAKINFDSKTSINPSIDRVSSGPLLTHFDSGRHIPVGMALSTEYDRVVTIWTSKRDLKYGSRDTIFVNVWDQPSQSPTTNRTYALPSDRLDPLYQLQLSKGFVLILSKHLDGCQVLDLRACRGNEEGADGVCRASYCNPWSSEEVKEIIPYSGRNLLWKASHVDSSFYSGVYDWRAGSLREADIFGTVSAI